MKRAMLLIVGLAVLAAGQVAGQTLSYDPYHIFPERKGDMGVEGWVSSPIVNKFGDVTSVDLVGKYTLTDGLEIGVRGNFGFLMEGKDSFSGVVMGAKWRLGELTALSVNVTPYNEPEEMGVAVGLMNSMLIGGIGLNSQLHLGFLDAYGTDGAALEALIQPVYPLSDRMFAYLDLLIYTDTDAAGDRLSVLMGPNIDYELGEGSTINAGVQFSVMSGDFVTRDTDFGVVVGILKDM